MRTRSLLVLAALLLALVGCSDDGGDEAQQEGSGTTGTSAGPPGKVTIYATNSLQRALPELEAAYVEANPGAELEIVLEPGTDLTSRIEGGERPDVYIDLPPRVGAVATGGSQPRPFGSDPTNIVVVKGNPAGVTSLAEFGDTPIRTGVCADNTPCGLAATAMLEKGGVTPAPDLVAEGWLPLLNAVVEGEVDAGILKRTEWISRINLVEIISTPPETEQVTRYEIVGLTANPRTQAFVDWVVNSDEADKTLRGRGLRDFTGAAAAADGSGTAGSQGGDEGGGDEGGGDEGSATDGAG